MTLANRRLEDGMGCSVPLWQQAKFRLLTDNAMGGRGEREWGQLFQENQEEVKWKNACAAIPVGMSAFSSYNAEARWKLIGLGLE